MLKKVLAVTLAASLCAASIVVARAATTGPYNALPDYQPSSNVVQTWDPFSPSANDRVVQNEDGTITTKAGTHNFFIWGLHLDTAQPAGTYTLVYAYKVEGTATDTENQVEVGYWDVFAGSNARFGNASLADGKWHVQYDKITAASELPTTQELRFKNMWSGDATSNPDFKISFGKIYLVSGDYTGETGTTAADTTTTVADTTVADTTTTVADATTTAAETTTTTAAPTPDYPDYAPTADVVKQWSPFSPDDNTRVVKNDDGTITVKSSTHDFFIWGLRLGQEAPADTYTLVYAFKATGTPADNEGQAEMGYWDVFAGANARFGGDDTLDGQWHVVTNTFTANSAIPADQELRFKNMWNGGDFALTFGPIYLVKGEYTYTEPTTTGAEVTTTTAANATTTTTKAATTTTKAVTTTKATSTDNVKTGDTAPVAIVAMLAVSSAAAVVASKKFRKK